MGRLENRTALITGATGGIGAATVRRFLDEGANVAMLGRSADKLTALRESLDADGRIIACVADAADESAIEAAVANTFESFGRLDVLFANAGTEGSAKPLDELTVGEFDDVYRTNVVGVWLAIKHCSRPMKEAGSGSVIVTASIAGVAGFAGLSAYVASKHAVCGLVRTAAIELGPDNIRVNAIAPGPVDNRMIHAIEAQLSPDSPDAVREKMYATTPLGRYATNEEVASLAVYLASDESGYCSGGIHMIDGGYTAA